MSRISVDTVRFHDFRLHGYVVSRGGEQITLDLLYDYPGDPSERSMVTFLGVSCYSFVHTEGAIITDIVEVPVATLVTEEASFFTESSALYGIRYWQTDLEHYINTLEERGLRSWEIFSAVGFYGFVIGASIRGHMAALTDPVTP